MTTRGLLPFDTGRRFSADEFAKLPHPPCPVCGAQLDFERIFATLNEKEQRERGDSYLVGLPSCPRGCNLQTGQRYHGSYKMRSDWNEGFFRFECSCGFDELIARDEVHRVFAEHKPGMYSNG